MDTELQEKPRVGRPTLYKPSFAKTAKRLIAGGFTKVELARHFNVNLWALYDWKEKYPDFRQAMETSDRNEDLEVVSALFDRAKGYSHPSEEIKVVACGGGMSEIVRVPIVKQYPPDVDACKLILRNRRSTRKEWNQVDIGDQSDPMAALAVRLAQELANGKARTEHGDRLKDAIEVKASLVVDQAPPEMVDGDGI